MGVLTASDDVEAALLPIAERLFLEVSDCGCLFATYVGAPRGLEAYATRRLRPAVRLCQLLESVGALRFSGEQAVPHGYALGHWPDDVPISGYADADGTPPSLVVASTLDDWETTWTGRSTFLRLLRAALHVAHRDGIDGALRFLVGLHAAGRVVQSDTMRRVIQQVLIARGETETDAQAIELLLGGPAPDSPRGWQAALTRLPALPGEYRVSELPAACRATVNGMLVSVLAEVEQIRRSSNYDDWLVGFGRLRGLLFLVRRVLVDGGADEAVAVKAILSRLEEIEMDCGATIDSLEIVAGAGAEQITTRHSLDYAREQVGRGYRDEFGEDWAERLCQDRLVVPEALGSAALVTADPALPEVWARVSWRLAHPFACRFGLFGPAVALRTEPFPIDSLLGTVDLEAHFERWPVSGATDRARAVRAAYRREALPWDAQADEREQDLCEAARRAHLRLVLAELVELVAEVDALVRDGRPSEAESELRLALRRYPWNDRICEQLAILAGLRGAWDDARDWLVRALVLEPEDPPRWGLLAVVLRELGRDEEARLADSFVGLV